jgi:3-deoxy-7-phosphoheptulonate synthase
VAINFVKKLPIPSEVKQQYPLSSQVIEIKKKRDAEIRKVFTGESDKFLLIIGPCSADNEDSVMDYIHRLARVQEKVSDRLILIPRIYTNKPRTTGEGYKGLLHQPDPSKKPDLLAGIIAMRKLHTRAIEETGLTAADEMLYPENWRYLDDLLSYVAIGARSVEDQYHRMTVSGMDVPAGMKNPTSGDLSVMFNSVVAAQNKHNFIYRGWDVNTDGNDLAHVILRGAVNKHGNCIPNYHYEDLMLLLEMYGKRGLKNPAAIVDTNHSNSNKQYLEQIRIAKEVMHSRSYNPELRTLVKGLMIESYIEDGGQKAGAVPHVYGQSITDPCLGWEKSERLIYDICEMC